MPHPSSLAPQAAIETSIGGASTSGVKGTAHAEVESEVTFGEHSFSTVERYNPCHLDYCKSFVMQA